MAYKKISGGVKTSGKFGGGKPSKKVPVAAAKEAMMDKAEMKASKRGMKMSVMK